jgi:hypothetical protein
VYAAATAAAAAATIPVAAPNGQTETAPDKRSTESDMVTLITTVQQIMTGLKTAQTEDDRFALIMRAVYRIVMKK